MTTYLLFSHPVTRRVQLNDLLGAVTATDAYDAANKLGLQIIATSSDYLLRNSEGKRYIMTQPVELKNSNQLI